MGKVLAPPPREEENEKAALKNTIEEQRQAARLIAEQRRASRIAEKKQAAIEVLDQAVSELNVMSQEASSSVNEMEQTIAEIAAGAAESSVAADESFAAVDKINAATDIAKRNTQDSLEKVETVQRLIRTTFEGIDSLISGVNTTVTISRGTTRLLETLEKQTIDIERYISIIVQTSDQINLLALNAAIESSHVGERGAGFSVIADEVMKLAKQTDEKASQIRDIAKAIIYAVNAVRENLEDGVRQTEQNASMANKITSNLGLAIEEIEAIQKYSREIKELADIQSSELTNIKKNSEQMADGASQIASATQEAYVALTQQSNGLESIVKNITDIDEQLKTINIEKYTPHTAEELATSAEELSASIHQINVSAQQITSAIDQIALAANQQSNAAQNNSNLATVVENAAKEIFDKAQTYLDKILNLQKILKIIDAESKSMIERISIALMANKESGEKVKALDEEITKLEKITRKLSTINIIANLIAVAGRIESTKAGEHGSGFAAVSVDIQELVEQSSDQLSDIEDILRLFHETITTIANDIEHGGNNVQKEADNAQNIISRLVRVDDVMTEVVTGIQEVQASADRSLIAIEEIKKSIDSTTQSAEQTSSACHQASTAIKEHAQAMRVLASTAEEIAKQADEL